MAEQTAHIATLFRAAWANIDDADPFAPFLRMSLESSAVGDPVLEGVLSDLKAPLQAELDLHLRGEGVTGHETNAQAFGRFVARVARAVKEIAKDIGGLEKLPANLQVVGPSAGSVRVLLRAPEPHRPASHALVGETDGDSLDTLAMKQLAGILAHAEEGDEIDSSLTASVRSLKAPARTALRTLAKSVANADWQIDGELRQRGQGVTTLRVTNQGAKRLMAAAGDDQFQTLTERKSGTIDGQRRSLNTMWFVSDDGRSFEAAVSAPDVLKLVGELAADPENRVSAQFDVYVSYGTGDSEHARRSYRLRHVEAASRQLHIANETGAIEEP